MTTTIQAVFENGVFRPLAPLSLPEGQQVEVVIATEDKETVKARDSTGAAEDLSEEEFEACLDGLAEGLDLPVLPADAYSREGIYGGG
jgi:predicted DNA-binding antitoxin AbrB/MazE fold protein